MGNKVISFLGKWDCLGQNEPTLGSNPIKVKDMILKEALEEKRAETSNALENYGKS